MKKNFLLVGGNFINKGAEAMVKTVRQEILKNHGEADIYIICSHSEKEVARKEGFIPLSMSPSPKRHPLLVFCHKAVRKIFRAMGGRVIPYADPTPLSEMREKIQDLHMGIDVSGYAYNDVRGYRQPLETIKAISFCRKHNAKYIFMPQAWGSFASVEVARHVKRMLMLGDVFFVRDEASRNYVAELLSREPTSIPIYPDIAFNFRHPGLEKGQELLKQVGYAGSPRKLVGISPNMRVYERAQGKGADNLYVIQLQVIIRHIISKMDMDVVLVPNEMFPGGGQRLDDGYLCRLLHEKIDERSRCFLISGYYSAEVIKSIIGNTDMLITSRFHSLIFALSQSVPCMAISWSHKYKELMKLFDMEGYVVEDVAWDEQELLQLLERLAANRADLREVIGQKLRKINSRVAIPLSEVK